jgi:hypothetical protein
MGADATTAVVLSRGGQPMQHLVALAESDGALKHPHPGQPPEARGSAAGQSSPKAIV